MGRYAQGTAVPIDRSRQEIESILCRYGADDFLYYRNSEKIALAFRINGYPCKITIRMPQEEEVSLTETGRQRKESVVQQALEAELRRRWRVLVLSLKARLESIDAGCETVEQAFGGIFLLKSGMTVGEELSDRSRIGSFENLLMAPKAP